MVDQEAATLKWWSVTAKYSKKDDDINTLDEEIKQLELQYKIDGLPEEKKLLLNSVLKDSELKEILKEKIL